MRPLILFAAALVLAWGTTLEASAPTEEGQAVVDDFAYCGSGAARPTTRAPRCPWRRT